MANQNPTQSQTPPADSNETQEQRVARERLADLSRQASEAAAETQTARSEAAAAKGDLERANSELIGLREQNKRLTEQLENLGKAAAVKDQLPALPVELPVNAKQLLESVTIATLTEAGPVRANPKRGDVVLVGKPEVAEELQGKIGTIVRVYAVDKQTAAELAKLKHVAA
jgi:chromosome segregation ATPase